MIKQLLLSIATVAILAWTSLPVDAQQRQNPDLSTIETRIGKLQFQNGLPTAITAAKLHEERLFQAAVQIYMWAHPLVAVAAVRDSQRAAGINNGAIPITKAFLQPDTIIPTGNQETVYAYAVLTLDKPMVLEVVPGVLGFAADAWQRPIEDIGLTGPDKGKGGKFLLLPPRYKGRVPKRGYFVLRSPTFNVWWLLRGFVGKDGNPAPAVESLKKVRIYPLSQDPNPQKQQYVDLTDTPTSALAPEGFEFWELAAKILTEEPVAERDRVMMGLASAIGIVHGKPFAPNEKLKAILTEAELVGRSMSKALTFATPYPGAKVYPDRHWEYVFLTKSPKFEAENHTEVYERMAFMWQAMTGAKSMVVSQVGAGSQYLAAFRDKDGAYLDGAKDYKLEVPAKVPVNNFWSVAVYDADTRSLINNGQKSVTRNSNMKLNKNTDGSVTLYFGPNKPSSDPANWVRTTPGKGFFLYFRFYGPLEPYFDKTWKPGDVELVN